MFCFPVSYFLSFNQFSPSFSLTHIYKRARTHTHMNMKQRQGASTQFTLHHRRSWEGPAGPRSPAQPASTHRAASIRTDRAGRRAARGQEHGSASPSGNSEKPE